MTPAQRTLLLELLHLQGPKQRTRRIAAGPCQAQSAHGYVATYRNRLLFGNILGGLRLRSDGVTEYSGLQSLQAYVHQIMSSQEGVEVRILSLPCLDLLVG